MSRIRSCFARRRSIDRLVPLLDLRILRLCLLVVPLMLLPLVLRLVARPELPPLLPGQLKRDLQHLHIMLLPTLEELASALRPPLLPRLLLPAALLEPRLVRAVERAAAEAAEVRRLDELGALGRREISAVLHRVCELLVAPHRMAQRTQDLLLVREGHVRLAPEPVAGLRGVLAELAVLGEDVGPGHVLWIAGTARRAWR